MFAASIYVYISDMKNKLIISRVVSYPLQIWYDTSTYPSIPNVQPTQICGNHNLKHDMLYFFCLSQLCDKEQSCDFSWLLNIANLKYEIAYISLHRYQASLDQGEIITTSEMHHSSW